MPGIATTRSSIPLGGNGAFSWSSYWTSLISATVEDAAPTDIILTFPTAKTLVASDFTCTVNGTARAVNSASWAGAVLTLVLASACVYGDVVVVTFVKTGGTANVNNNINAEAELTTYITGLTTPLSISQRRKTNEFIKSLKTGLSITNISDAFDCLWLLGGETSESSLKNLVKDAHHCTLQGTPNPTFTAALGFQGDGTNGYLNTNYNGKTQAVRYTLNNASYGWYSNTDSAADVVSMGARAGSSSNRCFALTRSAAGACSYDINQNGPSDGTPVITAASDGLFIVNRLASATGAMYRNNVLYYTENDVSTDIPNYNFYIIGYNNAGTAASMSARQKRFSYIGRGFSQAERTVIQNAVEVFFSLI